MPHLLQHQRLLLLLRLPRLLLLRLPLLRLHCYSYANIDAYGYSYCDHDIYAAAYSVTKGHSATKASADPRAAPGLTGISES